VLLIVDTYIYTKTVYFEIIISGSISSNVFCCSSLTSSRPSMGTIYGKQTNIHENTEKNMHMYCSNS